MKKLILIFWLLAVFVACSDDETETEGIDPFLPVTALEIPKQVTLGHDIVLYGKGFDKDCSVQLQINKTDLYDAEVLSVAEDSIVLRTSDLEAGFYIVLLTQKGQTYRIGGINLVASELENRYVDAIGVAGEENSKVYEISIAKKMRGKLLFAMNPSDNFMGGVVSNDVWYYATYWLEEVYEGDRYIKTIKWYTVSAYDLNLKTNKVIKQNFEGFLALGLIEGQMHIFSYDAEKCYIQKWENEAFQSVVEFNNLSANKMIIIYDGIFLYDAASKSLVMSGQDMTGSTRKFVWTVNMKNPQIQEIGGESAMIFHLVDCNGKFYAFAEKEVNDNRTDTYVVRLQNPSNWKFADLNPLAVFEKTFFGAPVYRKDKNVIYGIDDGETVATYDIQTKQFVGGKWVGSGMVGVFLLNN